ncbi:MAG TPA: FRG domain-containing protein [Gemmatimonadaceae bacterium]
MPIETIVVRTLGELVDHVTPREPDPVTGHRRDVGVYRGAADASRPLLTSLDRLGGIDPPHTKAKLEAHILRNFVRYSRPYMDASITDEWEVLVAAQHHGLPTRLLDWTYSPLVAAHFATVGAGRGTDRAVWRLDWQRVHETFGFPPLSLLPQDVARALDRTESRGEQGVSPWRLFESDPERTPFACLIEPPSLDERIVAQSAVFTLCSDTSRSLDRFLEEQGLADALMRLVVPAADVARIRDQLDLVGVDERRLFPDLDGVAAQMCRYYS